MKYYSEKTDKLYDSVEECMKAETEAGGIKSEDSPEDVDTYLKDKDSPSSLPSEEKQSQKNLVSKKKKELSSRIAEADEEVDKAYKNLFEAKKEASNILKEANKRADDVVEKALNLVREKTGERALQISNFNKEFGPYMVTYTGKKAEEEYNKIINQFHDLFNVKFPFIFPHWPFF